MPVTFEYSDTFDKTYGKAPDNVKEQVQECLKKIIRGDVGSLRIHRLNNYKPPVFKFDVFPNKSWQVAFHREGDNYKLLRLGTHKYMDKTFP